MQLSALFFLLVLPLSAFAQLGQLEGTWSQTGRDDGQIQEKTWLAGRWHVFRRDLKSRNLTFWAGGSYVLKNDGSYVESYDYHSAEPDSNQLGRRSTFQLHITGNQLAQQWTDNSGYAETYWCNKSFGALPSDHRLTRGQLTALFGHWPHYDPRNLTQSLDHGIDLREDASFIWQLPSFPIVVKGTWCVTQVSPTSDRILHLLIGSSGVGTNLLSGQVLAYRVDVQTGVLTLVSKDGLATNLYSR